MRLTFALLAVLATPLPATPPAPPDGSGADVAGDPRHVVERLHQAMLDVMKEAGQLGFEQRARRLRPVVEECFDLPFMARFVVGSRWRKLSAGERRQWLDLFTEYMVANYAGQLRGYSGERFHTLGTEDAPRATVLVRTRLIRPGDEPIELTYRLRKSGDGEAQDGWRIIDIYLKGTVSELALRRSDYAAVLDQSGFPGLVESIRGKISELAAGRGEPLGSRQG